MDKAIKIILSILLLLCLADMPYGYYQLVRFGGAIGFSILAYKANEEKMLNQTVVYICLALLFQPFIKIALGRTIWNVLDVTIAIGLLYSLFISGLAKKTKS